MMRFKKNIFIILLIVLLFTLGYLRDFVFVNINDALYYTNKKEFPLQHSIHPNLSFLLKINYNTLYYSKWLLTIIFSVLFFINSFFILKLFFPSKNTFSPLAVVYLFLIISSTIVTLIGIVILDNTWTYKLSRFLMGIAQSALPLMILIFALKLLPTKN